MTIKCSVLIPCLNEEKYLPILLTSLKRQTMKDFEVIVCDGNSTDKTVKKARSFRPYLNLKTIVTKKRNISFQRNLAASKARTDKLIFLDADTIVDKSFIAKVYQSSIKDGFDLATSYISPISTKLFDKIIFNLFNRVYLETAKYHQPGGAGAFIFVRKDVLKSVGGFDTTTNYGEDFDFIKRVCKEGYRYHLFRSPAIKFSVRRLDKEGRLFYLYKMLRSGIYYHIHGTIRNKKIYIKNDFGKF